MVTGDIVDVSQPVVVPARLPQSNRGGCGSEPVLTLSAWLYYCAQSGKTCTMKAASFTQPLRIDGGPAEGGVAVSLAHKF